MVPAHAVRLDPRGRLDARGGAGFREQSHLADDGRRLDGGQVLPASGKYGLVDLGGTGGENVEPLLGCALLEDHLPGLEAHRLEELLELGPLVGVEVLEDGNILQVNHQPLLHGPVRDQTVPEGLDVGLPPALQLPYGLDDLLVEAREPPGERARDAVRELEGSRPALLDHTREGLAWDLDRLDAVHGLDGSRRPTRPEQPPLPHDGTPARSVDLGQKPAVSPGKVLPNLHRARGEHEQTPLLRTLLDDVLPRAERNGLRSLGELLPLLLSQELEEPDPLQSVFHASLSPCPWSSSKLYAHHRSGETSLAVSGQQKRRADR